MSFGGPCFSKAFRSMPELKNPPAPVMTPTRNAGSASRRSTARSETGGDGPVDGVACLGTVDRDEQDAVLDGLDQDTVVRGTLRARSRGHPRSHFHGSRTPPSTRTTSPFM